MKRKMSKKWKRIIRKEADAEFFACVHGASMIFMYGLLMWFGGYPSVPFSVIFEMMLLGYLTSWVQKAPFRGDTKYGVKEYRIREVLWCLLPCIMQIAAGCLLGWFDGISGWIAALYYGIMVCYFVMVRIFIKYFYQEDTDEMNRLLKKRRQYEKEDGGV